MYSTVLIQKKPNLLALPTKSKGVHRRSDGAATP